MNSPSNNPILQLVQMVRGGGNPMQLLKQMVVNDPRMAQAMKMVQGKNTQQLQQMAQNMARERGTSVEEVIQNLGLK